MMAKSHACTDIILIYLHGGLSLMFYFIKIIQKNCNYLILFIIKYMTKELDQQTLVMF